MKHILFVDDETKILDAIRRTLRPMRDEWNMMFFESGQAALDALANRPCDVIIADIRMPNMNGVELLTKIKSQYPHIIRIALSGYADSELMAECTKSAHQFLSKPCEIETVKNTISKVCKSRDSLTHKSLISFITKLDALPSLPSLYSEILEEMNSPDGSLKGVSAIISKDVSMTAKLLQLVNSSFYGLPRNVSTVHQAATMLGFDVIRSLVLGTKIFNDYDSSGALSGLDLETLWLHSGQVGAVAYKVAKLAGANSKICDYSQMAGVLHDIGLLVFRENMPLEYREALALSQQESIQIWLAERKIIGHTHMEVGAYILTLWGIQNVVVEAVAYHHYPSSSAPEHEFSPLSAVHIANSFVDAKYLHDHAAVPLDESYLSNIGVIDKISQWRKGCMDYV